MFKGLLEFIDTEDFRKDATKPDLTLPVLEYYRYFRKQSHPLSRFCLTLRAPEREKGSNLWKLFPNAAQ